ncbi:male-enhanced antigen 1 [Betta splendens]|uniref:Male-enhanced antigen 1 n=1 Tax=Betta splendens TaxID=158456 RepID=A0A6P7KLV9_BETSP|nr:male-enhanced antigen 1 [Betta splendens]XP_055358803.1 male-enhanced antigen 1 [Betta splendens]
MEVCSSAMGPERVLPSSEDELREEERPGDGALLPVGAVWSGGEEAAEGETELDGEEEEEAQEEVNSGGYYYQPLNQDLEGTNDSEQLEQDEEQGEGAFHTVQHRIEVLGLHLPDAPPADSDEEEDPEGAAALRSRAFIPMDADHVELVKRTMAAVALPSLAVPAWAREISDDQWTDMVQHTLQSRQSGTVRLGHRGNITGP